MSGLKPGPTQIVFCVLFVLRGGALKEMLTTHMKDEESAVKLYRQTIAVAEAEGDIATAQIFKKILQDEEEHHDFFQGLLEGMK
jgi:bacterioferritin